MATILGTIDQGGDGHAVLLALYNAKEGTSLQLSDFVFSIPVMPTENNPIRNTKIKMYPYAASGYYGVKTIYYNRIHLSELGVIRVTRGNALTLVDLLPAINSKYGVDILPTDVINYTLPALTTSQDIVVDITFSTSSVVFYAGDKITLEGDITAPSFVLDTIMGGVSNGNDAFSVAIDITGKTELHTDNFLPDNDFTNYAYNLATNTLIAPPFAYMWKNGAVAYGITKAGAVLQTSGDGSIWQLKNKITSEANLLPGARMPVNQTVVHAVGNSNSVYVIVKNTLTSSISYSMFVGSINGDNWIPSSDLSAMSVFNSNNTNLTPENVNLSSVTLSVIVSGTGFLLSGGNSYALPAVETLNLVTNATTVISLSTITISNDNFTIGDSRLTYSKYTFVNNVGKSGKLIAGYALIKGTNTPAIVWFDLSTQTPTATFVGTDVNYSSLDNGSYISSYSIPLPLTADGFLDVIEIPIRTPVQSGDLGYFLNDKIIDTATYYTYGVRIYKSIRVGGERRKWTHADYQLGSKYKSSKLTINNVLGSRTFTAQPSSGITRSVFTWNDGAQDYLVTRELLFKFESSYTYNKLGTLAAGDLHDYRIVENPNGIYGDLYANIFTVSTGFEYSFSLTSGENKNWAVGSSSSLNLQLANNFSYSPYFNKVPVAVFADVNTVYALLQDNRGVISSVDGGVTWTGYSQHNVFAKAEGTRFSTTTYLSNTSINLKPSNIVGGGVENGYLTAHVKFTGNIPVVGFNNGEVVLNVPNISTDALITFNGSASLLPRYPVSTQTGVTSLNLFGEFEYLEIKTYACTTIPNSFDIFGSVNNHLSNTTVGTSAFSIVTDKTVTVVTATRRVGFLDLNYLVSCYEQIGNDKKYYLMATRTTGGVVKAYSLALAGGGTGLDSFVPSVAMHVWDYIEAKYMPYVIYGNKQFLLAGKLDNVDAFNFSLFTPTILGDNGNDLIPVPLLNGNRQDYLFYQKGNGIFKVAYSYNSSLRVGSVTLVRVFDVSAWPQPYWEFSTGTIRGHGPVTAPTEFEFLSTTEIMIPGFSFFDNGGALINPVISGIYELPIPTATISSPDVNVNTTDVPNVSVSFTNLVANSSYVVNVLNDGVPTPLITAPVTSSSTGTTAVNTPLPLFARTGNYAVRANIVPTTSSNVAALSDNLLFTVTPTATAVMTTSTPTTTIGTDVPVTTVFARLPVNTTFTVNIYTNSSTPISSGSITSDANGNASYSATVPGFGYNSQFLIHSDITGIAFSNDLVITVQAPPADLPDVSNATITFGNPDAGPTTVGAGNYTSTPGAFAGLPTYTYFVKKIFISLNGAIIPNGEEVMSYNLSSGPLGRINTSTSIGRPGGYTDTGPYLVWVELWDTDNTALLLTTGKLEFIFE